MFGNEALSHGKIAALAPDWAEGLGLVGETVAADMAGLTVRVHDSMTDAALWEAWDALEASGHLTVFQSRFFMERFLREIPQAHGGRPVVAVVDDAHGRPLLIAPFVLLRRQGLRILELADLDLCDYSAPLLAAGARFDAASADMLWRRLLAALPPADAVRMKKMPDMVDSLANPFALLPGAVPMGVTTTVVPMEGVDITKSGAYKDAAGKIRKMRKDGTYEFVAASDPDEAAELVDVMIDQRHHRCRELGHISNLDDPRIGGFFRRLAIDGCSDGRVSVTAIRFNGECVATILGYVYRGRYNGIITAMGGDEHRRYSPGLCNMVETQAHWKAAGLDTFDIGVGALHYKSRFNGFGLELFEYQQALTLRGHAAALDARARRWGRRMLENHPEWNRRIRRLIGK
jgi:Protein involved in cellulose biosynthesis (CelD)